MTAPPPSTSPPSTAGSSRRSLGRIRSAPDRRTLRLRSYLHYYDAIEQVQAPPPARDWSRLLNGSIGWYANDRIGTCTVAATAHLRRAWTSQHGADAGPTEEDVIAAYRAVSGYDPADPSTDRGAAMRDVLKLWRSVGIGGHKIGAFARVWAVETDYVRAAINLFGGLYVGASIPLELVSRDVEVWDVTSTSGPRVDHAMAAVAYDRSGLTLLTWGQRQRVTWDWFTSDVDECYAVFSDDWVSGAALAPNGIDIETLRADLARIGAAA